MSKSPSYISIVPSILDRLLDDDPARIGKLPIEGKYRSIRELRTATRRTLNMMVAAKQPQSEELAEELAEINKYFLASRLSDLGQLKPNDSKDREEIVRRLKDALVELERIVSEPLTSQFHTVRQLRNVVARDLEAMLNTRQESLTQLTEEFTELQNSLLTYGLPDVTSYSLDSLDDRNQVRRAVEDTIAAFEPRLEQVRVTLQPGRDKDRGLNFRIDAMLRVDPAPEPVTFDAILELDTHQYVVRGQS
jgi:type VI secretion system protein ImpF